MGDLSLEKAIEMLSLHKPATPVAGSEWPKVLYHARIAPGGRLFTGPDELAQAEPGWSEKPL